MTTTVLIARHGQTDSNVNGFFMGWSGEDINEVGRAQAHRLSSRLASLPISSVYTSPLRRTLSTANIVAAPHNLTPKVLEDLVEINTGDWQGKHMDEISQKWPELWQQSRTDPSEFAMPNGESFHQVTRRAARALETIMADNPEGHSLIVTHDVIARVLVAHVLGVSNSIYRRFEIGNASLSTIRIVDGKIRLVNLNDTSHLDDLGR